MEPQRNKRDSTPLPLPRDAASIGPGGGGKLIIKSGTSATTNCPGDSTTSNKVGPDAMTWTSTWEMRKRSLRETLTRVKEEVANPGKPSRSQKILRTTQTDASTLGWKS